MEDKLLSADETAASLHITKATLYKLVKSGRVPARKIGGKWKFTRQDIEELFGGPSMDLDADAGSREDRG